MYLRLLELSLRRYIKNEYPKRKNYYVNIISFSILSHETIEIHLCFGADKQQIMKLEMYFSIKYKYNFSFIKGVLAGTIISQER